MFPSLCFQARSQALAVQLTDTQAKLAAAKEESKSAERSAEQLKEELEQVKGTLADVMSSYEKAQQKSGKQEVHDGLFTPVNLNLYQICSKNAPHVIFLCLYKTKTLEILLHDTETKVIR